MVRDLELLYFADPMCSWCWGFSPVMKGLKTRFDNEILCSTVMGGLYPGESPGLTPAFRNMLQEHWREVEAKTGQVFDYENAAPLGSVYNTEPPSRALVLLRNLAPEYEFDYLWALQGAFYQQARDLSDPQVLVEIVSQFGIDGPLFLARFESPDLIKATQMDFQLARDIQAHAFPTIVLRAEHNYTFVTIGYQHYEVLELMIATWLRKNGRGSV